MKFKLGRIIICWCSITYTTIASTALRFYCPTARLKIINWSVIIMEKWKNELSKYVCKTRVNKNIKRQVALTRSLEVIVIPQLEGLVVQRHDRCLEFVETLHHTIGRIRSVDCVSIVTQEVYHCVAHLHTLHFTLLISFHKFSNQHIFSTVANFLHHHDWRLAQWLRSISVLSLSWWSLNPAKMQSICKMQSDQFVLSECADVDILLHICTLGFLEVQ